MFDPITDRKVELCLAAAQMAADGDVPPCAAARLAVAQELKEKAARINARALRAPSGALQAREQGHARELQETARRLEHEAATCTATG